MGVIRALASLRYVVRRRVFVYNGDFIDVIGDLVTAATIASSTRATRTLGFAGVSKCAACTVEAVESLVTWFTYCTSQHVCITLLARK